MMTWKQLVLAGLVAGSVAAIAAATPMMIGNETVNYSYDARGRLVTVTRSGDVNPSVVTNYSYDKAENRVNVTTTGAP